MTGWYKRLSEAERAALIGGFFAVVAASVAVFAARKEEDPSLDERTSRVDPGAEVFTRDYNRVVATASETVYADLVRELQSYDQQYAPISTLDYFSKYIQNTQQSVEARIGEDHYLFRHARQPSSWSSRERQQLRTALRAAITTRVGEIVREVEATDHGPFFLSEDKIALYHSLLERERVYWTERRTEADSSPAR